jgi:hypothetical protein
MDDRLFHSVMKETVTRIASFLASRIYEFHVAHKGMTDFNGIGI